MYPIILLTRLTRFRLLSHERNVRIGQNGLFPTTIVCSGMYLIIVHEDRHVFKGICKDQKTMTLFSIM